MIDKNIIMKKEKTEKELYVSPTIVSTTVELEQGIAAGSIIGEDSGDPGEGGGGSGSL